MPALPAASTATAAAATEGDVKNFLTALRDYLNGLLGSSGLPADARAALGVQTMTGNQIISALGFTPAASGHTHAYAPMTAVVSIVKYEDGINRYIRYTRANGAVVDVQWGNIYEGGGGE